MTDGDPGRMIPARITASQLAETTGLDLDDLLETLRDQGHVVGKEEVLGADLAISVAGRLGVSVTVEPRDLALECLYEFETRGELGSDMGGKAGAIVDGVVGDVDDLDAMIESVSERWSVARMPVVDRNILRIGLYELRSDPGTPTAVIISEAVRLAQTYSTQKSPSFVNGVLAALAKTIRES
jgi:transcription antitermination factor NusB